METVAAANSSKIIASTSKPRVAPTTLTTSNSNEINIAEEAYETLTTEESKAENPEGLDVLTKELVKPLPLSSIVLGGSL